MAVTRSRRGRGPIGRPNSEAVVHAEEARAVTGAGVVDVTLTAGPATVEIGGRTVDTWAFNGAVPAPTIRATAGDVLRARVVNNLSEELTVHWHGIALRNDMDGVPELTQNPIAPGAELLYEFTLPDPGSYFYHPHTGTQPDRGLYGALVVDNPSESTTSTDIPVLLDDWIDGTGQNPDEVLDGLMPEPGSDSSMPGMDHGSMSDMDHGSMPGMDMGTRTRRPGRARSMRTPPTSATPCTSSTVARRARRRSSRYRPGSRCGCG